MINIAVIEHVRNRDYYRAFSGNPTYTQRVSPPALVSTDDVPEGPMLDRLYVDSVQRGVLQVLDNFTWADDPSGVLKVFGGFKCTEGLFTDAALTVGVVIDLAAAATKFLVLDTGNNQVKHRSPSGVLSDIGAQASLTFGILNGNSVVVDSSTVNSGEYARFTASGLESLTAAELATDIGLDIIGLQAVTDVGSITTNDIKIYSASAVVGQQIKLFLGAATRTKAVMGFIVTESQGRGDIVFAQNGFDDATVVDLVTDDTVRFTGDGKWLFGFSTSQVTSKFQVNNAGYFNGTVIADDAVASNELVTKSQLDAASTGAVWGSITGTLSDQTDLQSALDSKQDNLTFGILNTNTVVIDSATINDDEYARFTDNGLESMTFDEVRDDLNVADGATPDQDLSGLVPYINATTDLDLGAHSITAASGLFSGVKNTSILRLASTTNDSSWVPTTDFLGKIEFYSADSSGFGVGVRYSIQSVAVSTTGGTTALTFDHQGVEMMRIFTDRITIKTNLTVTESITASTITNSTGDFLTAPTNGGLITQRTAAQVLSDIGGQASLTPAALTKVNDTNVTLTLGGTPNTSLLQATSLTLGWTGTLADGRIASSATWNAKQDALTFGILNGNTVVIDSAFVNDDEYARFTANGLESMTFDEVRDDLNVADGATVDQTSIVGITGTKAQFDTACTDGNFMYIGDAPTSHAHGNITNAGYIGSTVNLPIITGTSGILQVGAFGTSANSFCEGNDGRLSDARTPLSHALLSHTIAGETSGHVLAADSATTYSIRQLLGSEIDNTESWAADQDLSGYALIGQTMYIGTTAVAINRGSGTLNLAGIGTLGCGALTAASGYFTGLLEIETARSDNDETLLKIRHRSSTMEVGAIFELGNPDSNTGGVSRIIGYSNPSSTANSKLAFQTWNGSSWNNILMDESGNLIVDNSITAATLDATNLSTGFIPYDNGTSLVNSVISQSGGIVSIDGDLFLNSTHIDHSLGDATTLSIEGSSADKNGSAIIELRNDFNSADHIAGFIMFQNSASADVFSRIAQITGAADGAANKGKIILSTYDGTSFADGIVINSTSNVSIPNGDLEVSGFVLSDGEVTAHSTSDLNLKRITGEIQNPLALIKGWKMYEFYWNDLALQYTPHKNTTRKHYGAVAQDFLKHNPEFVHDMNTKHELGRTLGMEYKEFGPIAIAAVNQLAVKVETNEQKILRLENEVKELKENLYNN